MFKSETCLYILKIKLSKTLTFELRRGISNFTNLFIFIFTFANLKLPDISCHKYVNLFIFIFLDFVYVVGMIKRTKTNDQLADQII